MRRSKNTMDLIKNAKGNINTHYIANVSEIDDIMNNSNDIYDLVYNVFVFGYVKGTRAQKRGCAYNG